MRVSESARRRYRDLVGFDPTSAAGLLSTAVAEQTGTLVSVYRSADAGIEDDPEGRYSTVCEEHHTLICHATRRLAERHAADPIGWCEVCREGPLGP